MSPSRGLAHSHLLRYTTNRPAVVNCCRGRSMSSTSQWAALERDPRKRVHSFVSHSNDPHLNLAVESFLLKESPPESHVLFLYVNRPSIIIGRNQNPWLEVNLPLLHPDKSESKLESEPPGIGKVDLIRRVSGGGTVFHDEGNVNWTIICPPADFTRDKHAELVVGALRNLGVERARVNERHDIVLDQGTERKIVAKEDMHKSPFPSDQPPLKVSGSAYKLTRTRALHHGTCLLNSPNLNIIPDYLHSPAKPYIQAKGVGSVSSPISNIGLESPDFIMALQEAFQRAYEPGGVSESYNIERASQKLRFVHDMVEQFKSKEWTFGQTPQFAVNLRMKSQTLAGKVFDMSVHLNVRHGVVDATEMKAPLNKLLPVNVNGMKLYEIADWYEVLSPALKSVRPQDQIDAIAMVLNELFPPICGYGQPMERSF